MRTRLLIEPSERDTIFAQLRKKRKSGRPSWSTRRNGWKIRIWSEQSERGIRIHWQMTQRLRSVYQSSFTLTGAIEGINEVLQPKVVTQAPVETMPLVAASKAQEWLPYADN